MHFHDDGEDLVMNSQHGAPLFFLNDAVKRAGIQLSERNRLLSLASHLTLLKKAQSFNL